ncbi:hypothetical protein cyc_05136 [Cyclospora cayetanensis]|uniref:Uncharacterized protein n=1 Tax=Cyclospora cayetanensis TaxID=88456 RepID=A0A1D3D0Q8_9EIME|nr:hypothetical protein cyc_05136 [Cyclospora cayetanensis]
MGDCLSFSKNSTTRHRFAADAPFGFPLLHSGVRTDEENHKEHDSFLSQDKYEPHHVAGREELSGLGEKEAEGREIDIKSMTKAGKVNNSHYHSPLQYGPSKLSLSTAVPSAATPRAEFTDDSGASNATLHDNKNGSLVSNKQENLDQTYGKGMYALRSGASAVANMLEHGLAEAKALKEAAKISSKLRGQIVKDVEALSDTLRQEHQNITLLREFERNQDELLKQQLGYLLPIVRAKSKSGESLPLQSDALKKIDVGFSGMLISSSICLVSLWAFTLEIWF